MSPVLLITFNRPQYVKQVLRSLREANITELYVFKDGPRPYNESDIIASCQIENLISSIDWNCNVKTNYMNNNLGCGYGPYCAISWAFQYTDKLIILEDDCVPSQAFFPYCDYLLEKYKSNEKVRHISGYSPLVDMDFLAFKKYDYIFTQYAHTWGWATWKRVWDNFDMKETSIKIFFKNGGFTNQFSTTEENKYFNNVYWTRKSPVWESLHSWDYQYAVHSKINGALSIIPNCNLVSNIGIEGTHSNKALSGTHNIKTKENFIIKKEPPFIDMDKDYEWYNYQKEAFAEPLLCRLKYLAIRLKNKFWGRIDF